MLIDFLVGFITVMLIVIFIPLLWFVFHLSIMIAIPLGIVVGIFFGLVVIGKIIRYIHSSYKKENDLQARD
jgi:membrane protein YdbS with pleckstrin-like domain